MELSQTSICYYEKRLAGLFACTESADSIVPDTFPDIGQIVCAYGTAEVKERTPQDGRLLVSGVVQTVVLYQPEQGEGVRRLTVPVSFAHIEECDGLNGDAVCFVSCRTASVEAVPVNSRKLNVTVQLCCEIECYGKAECTVTEQVELPKIQLLRASRSVSFVRQVCPSAITVLEDMPLQEAGDLQLLHTDCELRLGECRAMRGKAVLKGEAVLRCLALQEDGAVRTLSDSTPFTQIIDVPELQEGEPVSARLAVRALDCRIASDQLLSSTVSADVMLVVRETREVQQIRDLYVPGRSLQIQETQSVLHTMPAPTPFTANAEENVQTAHKVSRVVSAEAVCCAAKRAPSGELQMTAAVQVLYLNDAQQICAVQRMLPLTAACAAEGELSAVTLEARAVPAGETGLRLSISVSGSAAKEEKCVFRCFTAIQEGSEPARAEDVTLVLRYVDQPQPLWSIAKTCSTTMDAIRRANDLPEDADSVGQTMLLIPIQL